MFAYTCNQQSLALYTFYLVRDSVENLFSFVRQQQGIEIINPECPRGIRTSRPSSELFGQEHRFASQWSQYMLCIMTFLYMT